MIKIGVEDKIWPDPMGQSVAPFIEYLANRKQDIHHLSMISEVFYGSAMTAKATGRALSVLMQGAGCSTTKSMYRSVQKKVLPKKEQAWRRC